MNKFLFIGLLIFLANFGFVQSANYPAPFLTCEGDNCQEIQEQEIQEQQNFVQVYGSSDKDNEPIDVCKKIKNLTLLRGIDCIEEIKSSNFRYILKELVSRQDVLISELNKTKAELEQTKKELRELKDFSKKSNKGDVENSFLTGDSIITDFEKTENDSKKTKKTLNFFKQFFNKK